MSEWSPESWRSRLHAHQVRYADAPAVDAAVARLRTLPPLVTSWEIERLKSFLAEAQEGRRFVLQGGDCAETLADCRPAIITSRLKILLQMSIVLVHGLKRPVVRIGRFAGQYAKPRSSPTETRDVTRDGTTSPVTLPNYFGDLVNRADFDPDARRPNPDLMIQGYQHAAMTLNFIRALVDGGFADLHHPEYWDLSFLGHAGLSPELRDEYERMTRNLADGLEFMEALGERSVDDLTRAEFFTSHEGLNLLYESAQTRRVPRRDGFYDLTTHLPWIGDRTRAIDGAHVEFFRGIRNPVGVKLGPAVTPAQALELATRLNPANEPGKLVFITRLGRAHIDHALPPLIESVASAGRSALWICDPMHGNTLTTATGIKTRSFDDIRHELDAAIAIHDRLGTVLGGVHIELTGEDVTECLGGAAGVTEAGLSLNYASPCDPRLNYQQSLELAFALSKRVASSPRAQLPPPRRR
ncbi:MAG: 3-deoxy-7-phosphoheptulonate synthase class II [Phycisphaerales bacterium]